jgi:hypothetical protein
MNLVFGELAGRILIRTSESEAGKILAPEPADGGITL